VSIIVQQDATIYSSFISANCCTCFGWYLHPSSGADTNVSTASGIIETVTVDTVIWPPDDWWRYHPKHVEQFADINKLYIVTSCWTVIDTYYAMHGSLNIKQLNLPLCWCWQYSRGRHTYMSTKNFVLRSFLPIDFHFYLVGQWCGILMWLGCQSSSALNSGCLCCRFHFETQRNLCRNWRSVSVWARIQVIGREVQTMMDVFCWCFSVGQKRVLS